MGKAKMSRAAYTAVNMMELLLLLQLLLSLEQNSIASAHQREGVGGYTLYSGRSFFKPLRPLRMMERLKMERSILNDRIEKKWPILEDLFESSDQGSRLGSEFVGKRSPEVATV